MYKCISKWRVMINYPNFLKINFISLKGRVREEGTHMKEKEKSSIYWDTSQMITIAWNSTNGHPVLDGLTHNAMTLVPNHANFSV